MIDLSNVEYKSILEIQKNTIETGFYDYDSTFFDLKPGEITILFGRDGEGKTTVASQILAHHINVGRKAYLFSGELSNNKIQEWLYKQVVGFNPAMYRTVETKYGDVRELKPRVVKALKRWHKHSLWIFDDSVDNHNADPIFQDIENATVCGVDLVVIDNLMTAFDSNANTEHADQSNFVQRCKLIAKRKNIHIIIVAHANKGTGELEIGATHGNLTKNDISGHKNQSNKADNIIAVERIFKVMNSKDPTLQGGTDMFMTSLKDRWIGQRKVFEYQFHKGSLRFYNANTRKEVDYDWQNYL